MLARVRSLSSATLRKARTAVHRATDLWEERGWERRRLSSYRPVEGGEVTALLHRMGAPGLNEYAAQQRLSRRRRSFIPSDRAAVIARLERDRPWFRAETIEAADRVQRGMFDLLGSGLVDMRRASSPGFALDWSRDLRTGARYPERFSHWRAALPKTLAHVHGDIKGPWEIGRCQHFAVLGQAYWFTGDERYAETFAATIADFLERNPPGGGVQWACTMDAALRVVGWLVGLAFFDGAPALTEAWWKAFLKSIVEHGRFIAANLEFGTLDGRMVTSNHYLSNLLGLCWIAHSFPELDTNNVWRGLAECGLEREIALQIHPDGGSFESSIPYQRLVVEMLLSAYAMASHAGHPFSRGYRERLLAALRLIRALRQPGGRLPQVGDCDNGRAHILTGYGTWRQESMDHLLAAGARVLNCAALAEGLDAHETVEAQFWDVSEAEPSHWEAPGPVALFPQSGLVVLRRAGTIVLLTNGPVGTEGFGNHKHCDQLAVEICIDTQPVFVDAGSYVYTSDPDARNRFRGTAIHNTVMIDGEEQHGLNPAWLFRLFQQGSAEFIDSGDQDGGVFARARHTAYARFAPPVAHERRVGIGPMGVVSIDDVFDRTDGHRFRWHFLLHPDVKAERRDHAFRLTWPEGGADFKSPVALEIVEDWYSPAYGVRRKTSALAGEMTGPTASTAFVLRPFKTRG